MRPSHQAARVGVFEHGSHLWHGVAVKMDARLGGSWRVALL
jgi:hypothetical protein